jgi:hypothetical protein
MKNARRACIWVVALHALTLVVHNQAHQALPVPLSTLQNAFAIGVIVVAPVLAAFLISRGAPRFGATLLVASMFGSLVFGVVNHYVLESPDNVAQIPDTSWGGAFRWSAHLMALAEVAGMAAGAWLLRESARAR